MKPEVFLALETDSKAATRRPEVAGGVCRCTEQVGRFFLLKPERGLYSPLKD